MPSRYGEPSRAQRAEIERWVIGFPCLLANHGAPIPGQPDKMASHEDCGRRIIVDRNASPDDWQDCRCSCHLDQVRREGPMTNKRAFVRDGGLNPSFADALARKRGEPTRRDLMNAPHNDEGLRALYGMRPDADRAPDGKPRIVRPTRFRDRS